MKSMFTQLISIEGIASDVRQARLYHCLFRLSGKPVALSVGGPVFIENGENVTVIGKYNQDGVFEACAYYNQSSGTFGKPEKDFFQWRGLLLAGAGIVFLLFLIVVESAVPSSDDVVGGILFLLVLALVGFVIIWGLVMFVQFRLKLRVIERLLSDAVSV